MGIAGCGRFGPGILTLTQERLTTGAFSSNYRTRKVSPTGATVDAEGFVWLALWDGWQITRYDPKGRVNKSVRLPGQVSDLPNVRGTETRNNIRDVRLHRSVRAGAIGTAARRYSIRFRGKCVRSTRSRLQWLIGRARRGAGTVA